MEVDRIMTPEVEAIGPETPLKDVVEHLGRPDIRHVYVVDKDGKLRASSPTSTCCGNSCPSTWTPTCPNSSSPTTNCCAPATRTWPTSLPPT